MFYLHLNKKYRLQALIYPLVISVFNTWLLTAYTQPPSYVVPYEELKKYCNIWRNYNDISDTWASVLSIIAFWETNQDDMTCAYNDKSEKEGFSFHVFFYQMHTYVF